MVGYLQAKEAHRFRHHVHYQLQMCISLTFQEGVMRVQQSHEELCHWIGRRQLQKSEVKFGEPSPTARFRAAVFWNEGGRCNLLVQIGQRGEQEL